MGLYINLQAVKDRLVGKVRFTDADDPGDTGRMPVKLANRLIAEAEGQVEQHLSPRYAAPFQTDSGDPFDKVPERPSREIIRTLCELQACMRVLETDFGAGSATDGDKYQKNLAKRYEMMRNSLLAKKDSGNSQGWKYPPLPGLRLNYMNTRADDGYAGMVIVASGSSSQGFATGQINDPSANWWNGWPSDDCD